MIHKPELIQTSRRREFAFTLVELLVVFTIISVLAALLLPALVGAKNRAKTVKCASNQRQIGAGMQAFLADHNGFYPYQQPQVPNTNNTPPTNTGWNGSRTWGYVLAPYLAGGIGDPTQRNWLWNQSFRSLFQCPANPWPFEPVGVTGWGGWTAWMPPSSYGMNDSSFPVNYGISGSGCGGGVAPMEAHACVGRRVRQSEFDAPSSVAFLGENPYSRPGVVPVFGTYALPMNNQNLFGFYWLSFTSGTTNLPNGAGNVYWRRADCSNINSVFHNLGANILFVDGRVERLSKRKLFQYGDQMSIKGTPGATFWNDNKGRMFYQGSPHTAPWPWDSEYW